MKNSIILDIFKGKRGHIDTMYMQNKTNTEKLFNACSKLEQEITPEVKEYYKDFVDELELSHVEEVNFYFCEGFKLGLFIGIECMED